VEVRKTLYTLWRAISTPTLPRRTLHCVFRGVERWQAALLHSILRGPGVRGGILHRAGDIVDNKRTTPATRVMGRRGGFMIPLPTGGTFRAASVSVVCSVSTGVQHARNFTGMPPSTPRASNACGSPPVIPR